MLVHLVSDGFSLWASEQTEQRERVSVVSDLFEEHYAKPQPNTEICDDEALQVDHQQQATVCNLERWTLDHINR